MFANDILVDLNKDKRLQKNKNLLSLFKFSIINSQKFIIDAEPCIKYAVKNRKTIMRNIEDFGPFPYDCLLILYKDQMTHNDHALSIDTVGNCSRIYIFEKTQNSKWTYAPFLARWFLDIDKIKITPFNEFYTDSHNEETIKNACVWINLIEPFLAVLNCKNIVEKNNIFSDKINKKRIRSGKLPLFEYKTLHIRPRIFLKDQNAKAKIECTESNRVHLCRGHIKTYTQERPLLGKHTGSYYWEPQVRGNRKKGMIRKDYMIDSTGGDYENTK